MVFLGAPRLVPDVNNSFVTGGTSNGDPLAARTSDGHLGVVYFIHTRTISVDMTKMSGSTTARWFDPSTGQYTAVSGSPFANTGQKSFTPPSATADGSPDFILLL